MMLTDIEKWRALCEPLSLQEMHTVTKGMHSILTLMRSIYTQKLKKEIREVYSTGDRVEFFARGVTQRGIVTNLNEKTLGILVGAGPGGTKWRVSPRYVTKLGRRRR